MMLMFKLFFILYLVYNIAQFVDLLRAGITMDLSNWAKPYKVLFAIKIIKILAIIALITQLK